jgi:hypothetical protein
MATQLQIRRGTSTQVAAFTGAEGEIVVNTTNDSVHVNDGSTQGGFELARVDGSNWAITNAISTTNNISFGDNDKAIFGAGSDLQIFHDGSNSHITEGGTGDLIIRGANIEIQTGGGNRYFRGASNAARLYHTNNEKLTTTAAGINVTGTVTADGLTVDGASAGTVTAATFTNTTNASGTRVQAVLQNVSSVCNVNLVSERVGANFGADFIVETSDTVDGTDRQRLRVAETGDISFYNSSGTSQSLFWDSSAESLGIGTTSPARELEVAGSGNVYVRITAPTATDSAGLELANTGATWLIQNDDTSNDALTFDRAGTEAMRILGNNTLLVGKTSDDNSVGFKTNTDSTYMVASGQTPTFINRLASDGVLLEFRKDSSAVGVIQAKSSQLSIGTGDTGIQTNQAVNAIIPHNTTTNANVDNSIDLGYAAGGTNLRFKDLKLSGGIYLGGVGSANKLDDYEQGSWTSTTTGITGANVTAANYTKIGQLVSCDMRVTWTGSTNDSTALTFSLPFTANNPGGASRTGIVFYQGTSILGGNAISAHVSVGGTVVSFYNTGGGTFRSILASDVNGAYDWLVSFTYFTDL